VAQENFLIRFAPHNEEFSSLVRSMTSARFREGGFRAQATFEHPLLLAEFSAIAAAFATASLVWSSSRPGLRCLGAVALFGAILTGLLTGSRSAYIALGLSIGTVLVLRVFGNRRPRLPDSTVPLRRVGVAIVAALGLVVALVALPHLARGGSVGDQASSEGRLLMVRAGLPSIERSPFFGEGPGAGASLAGLKVRSDMVTLDNYLLAITLESGVPALLLLVAALAYPVWQAYLSITRRSGADSAFVAAVAGALLAILAMRIILWMPYNMSFGFLFAAMALAACAVQAPRGLGR
jgi:O-antigen ligase